MRFKNLTAAFLSSLALTTPATAFDTGHHWDATYMGMAQAYGGFSETAKKMAATSNWLVDYFTESPISGGAHIASKHRLANLHFDNLFTEEQVRQTWNNLIKNYIAGLKAIANSHEPEITRLYQAYALMGMTLHATQDFYTHSNWATFHPQTGHGFSSKTVLHGDLTSTIAQSGTLQTGYYPTYYASSKPSGAMAHGDYTSGINKDSHMRPQWDEAFTFAYVESYRLTLLTITTLNEANEKFKDAFLKFNESSITSHSAMAGQLALLAGDAAAAYDVSQFIHADGADGHYKGKYSGNNANLVETTGAWTVAEYSALQGTVLGIIASDMLTKCLYDWSNSCKADDLSGNELIGNKPDVKALSVRIDNVEHTHGSADPFGNDPDYFAQFDFPGLSQWDRILDNKKSYKASDHVVQGEKASAYWAMFFVDDDTKKTSFRIRLYDYDAESSNDVIDIAHGGDNVDLEFTYSGDKLTGDVPDGVYDTRDRAVHSEGGSGDDRAKIKFFVYDVDLN